MYRLETDLPILKRERNQILSKDANGISHFSFNLCYSLKLLLDAEDKMYE